MDFVTLSSKHLCSNNVDYDIELLWYGLKSLVSNYFNNLLIDNINIVEYTNIISNKLNEYQENKEYLEIYKEIYKYLFSFLKTYVEYYERINYDNNQTSYKYNLVNTWLVRYNKIDYIKKIQLDKDYNPKIDILNISDETKIILKYHILGILITEAVDFTCLKDIDNNILVFMDFIIDEHLSKVFDLFSLRFNLDSYYKHKNINKKYTPVKFIKFKKLLYN